MDLSRRRTADDRAEAARRRLEVLGATLGSEFRAAPLEDKTEAAEDAPTGRHRDALAGRAAGEVPDRLPGRLRDLVAGPRLDGRHVVVVMAAVAVLLAVALWWWFSSRPSQVGTTVGPSVVAPTAAGSPAGNATVGPAPGGSADQAGSAGPTKAASEVVVDVTGRVRRPGIVVLPAGSRVVDALKEAGGARPVADLTSLNLARVLTDGEQLLVGIDPVSAPVSGAASPGSAATVGPSAPVDLNTATMAELDTLPGVGPVTAQAILDYRTENGGFSSVEDLLDVSGIGDVTFADLRDLVTV